MKASFRFSRRTPQQYFLSLFSKIAIYISLSKIKRFETFSKCPEKTRSFTDNDEVPKSKRKKDYYETILSRKILTRFRGI